MDNGPAGSDWIMDVIAQAESNKVQGLTLRLETVKLMVSRVKRLEDLLGECLAADREAQVLGQDLWGRIAVALDRQPNGPADSVTGAKTGLDQALASAQELLRSRETLDSTDRLVLLNLINAATL